MTHKPTGTLLLHGGSLEPLPHLGPAARRFLIAPWTQSTVKTPFGRVLTDSYHPSTFRPRDQSRHSRKQTH